MGYADLHIHSTYSWDAVPTVSAILKYVHDFTDLSVVAITDHDEIRGSLEAQQLAPAYGIQVVTGSEIYTAEGHLLALFIEKRIPPGLSLIETIQRVSDQGGLCIAAHPMARGAPSLTQESIRAAFRHPDSSGVLIGIETFNAGLFHRSANGRAQALATEIAQNTTVAQVGNSDSHILITIGQSATQFQGNSPAELRQALVLGKTLPRVLKVSQPWDIISGWLPRFIMRSAGWVAWNSHPSEPIRYVRSTSLP
jgi:hypothetical protein